MAPARAAYRTFRQEQLPMSDPKARHQVIQLNCQVGMLVRFWSASRATCACSWEAVAIKSRQSRTTAVGQKRARTEHPSRVALIRQVIMGTGTGA